METDLFAVHAKDLFVDCHSLLHVGVVELVELEEGRLCDDVMEENEGTEDFFGDNQSNGSNVRH